MKRNSDLRDQAYAALTGNWGMSALITLVFSIIVGGVGYIPFIGCIVAIALLPMYYAYYTIFLGRIRGEKLDFGTLFDGFTSQYFRYLGTMLLMGVYVFLWSLLLIVPGIIKACSYGVTVFLLKDTNLSFDEAVVRSMDMMEGYKMKFFLMNLSFIGWAILCCLTFGIGFFWLQPYVVTSLAAFYEDVKADYEAKTGATATGENVEA
jgi:uncharacterized membrane protein